MGGRIPSIIQQKRVQQRSNILQNINIKRRRKTTLSQHMSTSISLSWRKAYRAGPVRPVEEVGNIFKKKDERGKICMAFLDHIEKGERVSFKNNSIKTKISSYQYATM
jgi:hypothetical protein